MWSKNFQVDSIAFMSTDPRNPFRDWNLVFVPYCSGDMHAGQRTVATPDTYHLYFAGFNNLMASVDYLSASFAMNTTGNTVVWAVRRRAPLLRQRGAAWPS